MSIQPIITRMAYVTTENTGGSLDIGGPEGTVQMRRVDPHGVVISFGPNIQLSVDKSLLPILGRFAFAAALLQGVDINKDWDAAEQAGGVG